MGSPEALSSSMRVMSWNELTGPSTSAAPAPSAAQSAALRRIRILSSHIAPAEDPTVSQCATDLRPQPCQITRRFLERRNINYDSETYTLSAEDDFLPGERTFTPKQIAYLVGVSWDENDQAFGYHGTSQEFRLFQDVIRVIVEETEGREIPDTFHYFRVPGDPKYSRFSSDDGNVKQKFMNHCDDLGYQAYADGTWEGASRVVSLVASVFDCFEEMESAAYPFFNNRAIVNGPSAALESLIGYERRLGLPEGTAEAMLLVGRIVLERENTTGGVLYQFSDASETPFALVDHTSYVSRAFGFPQNDAKEKPTSSWIRGEWLLPTDPHLEAQLRLIMDNETTLNPDGPLRMTRFVREPEGTDLAIYEAMREVLRGKIQGASSQEPITNCSLIPSRL